MPDSWRKLERLQKCCTVEVKSYVEPKAGLCWTVTIRHRTRTEEEPVMAARPDMQAAIDEAIGSAEQRGWLPPPA